MGIYCLLRPGNTRYISSLHHGHIFIAPWTKLILFHALNQYVGKLNIVLKTFKKTKNIG
jgi:hypothetical protein